MQNLPGHGAKIGHARTQAQAEQLRDAVLGSSPSSPTAAIPRQLHELYDTSLNLGSVLEALEKRLDPIMRPLPPAANPARPEEAPECALSSLILSTIARTRAQTDQLHCLMDRLAI